ncbi:hypothetical protein B0J13DRAFT_450653 [Dactylonectria estremocensis]|uniref:Modin n=1 Tax=Dactylonectria estremocensis TaxID=1079267 RepID=A0A9P9E8I2_9HYPO|nr:hypothetical protein B0J13DRAFT_450653 [Dactylonectria estremocensis]
MVVISVFFFGLRLFHTAIDSAPRATKPGIGKWSRYTTARFNWASGLYDVEFETPAIFLALKGNTKGFINSGTVSYIDGSKESCEKTGSLEPDPDCPNDEALARRTLSDGKAEFATWLILLDVLQRMEKYSLDWEQMAWRLEHGTGRPEVQNTSVLAVGVQRYKQRFCGNNSTRYPFAITSMRYLVELAALLGLHWETFDARLGYRALGNGCSLVGTMHEGVGTVFEFHQTSSGSFRENRIILTPEIRELCVGTVPTFYATDDVLAGDPSDISSFTPENLERLCLGTREKVADTLSMIGCNRLSVCAYLKEEHSTPLFPVVFEIIGMLARTLHIKDRCFTYLPNPTCYLWKRNKFSPRRLLDAFSNLVSEKKNFIPYEKPEIPKELEKIRTMASVLNDTISQGQDHNYSPNQLNQLHETLDELDFILKSVQQKAISDVLRCHLQEVLLAAARHRGDATWDEASSNLSELSFLSFLELNVSTSINLDLSQLAKELVEAELMRRYFFAIRPRVLARGSRSNSYSRAESSKDGKKSQLANTTPESELSRDVIWCCLVFRMICWLMLHNFNEKDVQMVDYEEGLSTQVYIA